MNQCCSLSDTFLPQVLWSCDFKMVDTVDYID